MTDAISQGQAAEAGMPTSGTSARATKPAPSEIKVVVDSGSSPTLISAFQPAWQAAANKTARKTKFSIRNCYCRQQILQSLEICWVSFAGRESCAGASAGAQYGRIRRFASNFGRPTTARFPGSPVVLSCESNEIFPPTDTLVARCLREARVSFHKEKKEEITIREDTMGSSRLSRRAVLKTAALGSAAVITAPYVSGVHAAGTLTLGCWDHWVPGANKALDKICKEWGDKNK